MKTKQVLHHTSLIGWNKQEGPYLVARAECPPWTVDTKDVVSISHALTASQDPVSVPEKMPSDRDTCSDPVTSVGPERRFRALVD